MFQVSRLSRQFSLFQRKFSHLLSLELCNVLLDFGKKSSSCVKPLFFFKFSEKGSEPRTHSAQQPYTDQYTFIFIFIIGVLKGSYLQGTAVITTGVYTEQSILGTKDMVLSPSKRISSFCAGSADFPWNVIKWCSCGCLNSNLISSSLPLSDQFLLLIFEIILMVEPTSLMNFSATHSVKKEMFLLNLFHLIMDSFN